VFTQSLDSHINGSLTTKIAKVNEIKGDLPILIVPVRFAHAQLAEIYSSNRLNEEVGQVKYAGCCMKSIY